MFDSALTRTTKSPFGPRDSFYGVFDRVLDNFWNDSDFVRNGEAGKRTWLPAVDIYESDDAFITTADLPGLTKDDIDISIEDNVLTVSGERKFENGDEGTFRRVERSYGTFRRSFTLPRSVDSSKVGAKFEDGVLTLTLPKSEMAKSRKITVS